MRWQPSLVLLAVPVQTRPAHSALLLSLGIALLLRVVCAFLAAQRLAADLLGKSIALLNLESAEFGGGDVEGEVAGCVLFGPSSATVQDFLALQLHLLQLAALLDLGEVTAEQTVHVLELCDLFVAQAARAYTNSQAERTEPVLANIFVGIGVF